MMATSSCPECGSPRIWKDGLRCTRNGEIQRYICRECGYRFSETHWNGSDEFEHAQRVHREPLNTHPGLFSNCQICVSEPKGAKNLAEVESRIEKRAAGATTHELATIKGKIVEFAWNLKREGYSKPTIFNFSYLLRNLVKNGANLAVPESIKDIIAHQESWSLNTKRLMVAAYNCFAKMNGITWNPPKYKPTGKLPFIPLESEIDALIASTGNKMGCLLQLLKETGMRIGEALALRWIDVDLERYVVLVNNPEKSGNPRALKISGKLVTMINKLPKTNEKLFGKMIPKTAGSSLIKLRKRISEKLQNTRIRRIHFHALRHWKATMEYHKTKDILRVMKMLGHRNIQTTLIYTQLVSFEGDDFHSATAETVEEAKKLVEAGFEYVCTHSDTMLFRKRK
ncbi:MAG: tyrosine-type recombinase/integrase [Candidatus Bathyarchaeota archaeon]|nr:tyrosine-type recombinase/integrase [Candidatus Bathyarchaeota archaeon]